MTESIAGLLNQATAILMGGETDSPRLDAEILLSHALGRGRAWLFAHTEEIPALATVDVFFDLVRQRTEGVPVAYLTGVREFWSLSLRVTPDVLIPRPETEMLVDESVSFLKGRRGPVLDLGSGSGAISLAIASERPDIKVLGVDRSPAALAVARINADCNNISNVRFVESDWFRALAGESFGLIVANPPYIDPDDVHLSGEVRYEPLEALVSRKQGMADLEIIISTAIEHLITGGCLMVEHGFDQSEAVATLFTLAGYENVETIHDLAGLPRVTRGAV